MENIVALDAAGNKTASPDSKTTQTESKLFKALPWVMLAVSLMINIAFLIFGVYFNLDSDMSSEMILAKLISDEGGWVFSENWYYSTEIRVFNTQLIMVPLFKIFKSFKVVRILSSIICILIMLLSLFYFCCQTGLKKYFPYIACILVLPICPGYEKFVLYGLYYIPHLVLIMLGIGLVIQIPKMKNRFLRVGFICALLMIAFISGLGGLRLILNLAIPLVISAALMFFIGRKEKESKLRIVHLLLLAGMVLIFSAAGYIINVTVLSAKYSFNHYEFVSFTLPTADAIVKSLTTWISDFGYSGGTLFSLSLFTNATALLLTVIMVMSYVNFFKHRGDYSLPEMLVTLFTLSGIVLFACVLCFTDLPMEERFSLPVFFFLIPSMVIYFSKIHWENFNFSIKVSVKKTFVAAMILICLPSFLISGCIYMSGVMTDTDTVECKKIVKVLEKEGYKQGYGSFWNSNILTELSDGEIEVWTLLTPEDENDLPELRLSNLFEWLQKKSHFGTHPEGKVFVILDVSDQQNIIGAMPEENIIFNGENNIVYGFESYDALLSVPCVSDKDMSDAQIN